MLVTSQKPGFAEELRERLATVAGVRGFLEESPENGPRFALEIPEGVETIGAFAFENTLRIESVRLPSTLRSLGPGAFSNCGNLSVFNFTAGTANQGEGFDYTSDTSATTPWMETVRRDSTPTVSFDQNIISIGDYMFAGCSSNGYGISGALKLPRNLVSVGDHAFEGCNLITSVTIDSKVTTVGAYAFAG